jgi:hypothetical protein
MAAITEFLEQCVRDGGGQQPVATRTSPGNDSQGLGRTTLPAGGSHKAKRRNKQQQNSDESAGDTDARTGGSAAATSSRTVATFDSKESSKRGFDSMAEVSEQRALGALMKSMTDCSLLSASRRETHKILRMTPRLALPPASSVRVPVDTVVVGRVGSSGSRTPTWNGTLKVK